MKPRSVQARGGRRSFLLNSLTMATGLAGLTLLPEIGLSNPNTAGMPFPAMGPFGQPGGPGEGSAFPAAYELNIIGPKEGYSPQIGTLVSMMTWMRTIMLYSVKGMTTEQLDFLLDDKANTIGAMLWHLGATDTFYHLHTLGGVEWGKWDDSYNKKWMVPMELGDAGRKQIKGNNLDFYLNILSESREKTLAEFRKRDDAWLMTVDKKWPWGPTNNYCKWFHVCEHESNHNGQIKFLKSRLPGAKTGGE